MNSFNKYLIIFSFILFVYICYPNLIKAQNIDLSISPPLVEVMIQPGKEVKHSFTITNNGSPSAITPKLFYFDPQGDTGRVEITNRPAPDWIIFNSSPFALDTASTKSVELTFSPPSDASETDHLLSLVFETTETADITDRNVSAYKTQIASNILITISKDGLPKKSASIVSFWAPKIIDSTFGSIEYKLLLENNGNFIWKPEGKIIINQKNQLQLAPQNIASGHKRAINCLQAEEVVVCKQEKPFIGINRAVLSFSPQGNQTVYNAQTTTLAFPFTIVGVLTLLLLLTTYINKYHSVKSR